jgi:molecular chaperone DnaK
MYKAQADAQQEGGAPAGDAQPEGETTEENSDVEDVDFEEVK